MGLNFSPREIVSELDKFIIGQKGAKKAVAIALRNRWRRMQLPDNLKEEILPKNILMVGPTGCGKTRFVEYMSYKQALKAKDSEGNLKYAHLLDKVAKSSYANERDMVKIIHTQVKTEMTGSQLILLPAPSLLENLRML